MELKTLIVDDDKKLLFALKSLLGEDNHEVITCDNGLDAIKRCREEKFDLVITDLMMPGASGLEVLKETRKISPDTLVILITGFASLESAIQAIREGAYDYIAKPFKLEEMKLVVRNAGERIRLARENERLLRELQEAYRQLHIVKKVMGLEKGFPSDVDEREKHQQPFIAGSMLPQYYQENRSTVYPGLLSDLERISALVERGLLSEEEFSLCKSKLFRNLQA
jgi:DNA-binding response OmpR family regulator